MARWFGKNSVAPLDPELLSPREIVGRTGGIYADLNDAGRRFKPISALPAPMEVVKQAFKDAYRADFANLTEHLHCSYQHVYSELAFFLEDDVCALIQPTVDDLVSKVVAEYAEANEVEAKAVADVRLFNFLYSKAGIEGCREKLAAANQRSDTERALLAETCHFCSHLRILLWDEWAAYANFISAVTVVLTNEEGIEHRYTDEEIKQVAASIRPE